MLLLLLIIIQLLLLIICHLKISPQLIPSILQDYPSHLVGHQVDNLCSHMCSLFRHISYCQPVHILTSTQNVIYTHTDYYFSRNVLRLLFFSREGLVVVEINDHSDVFRKDSIKQKKKKHPCRHCIQLLWNRFINVQALL